MLLNYLKKAAICIFFVHISSIAQSVEKETNNIEETSTNYRILEVKEGEFQPKDETGKNSDKKFTAYFLSLESEDGEDEESYKRKNFNYIGVKAGVAMPDNLAGNSNLSGSSTKNSGTFGLVAGRKIIDRLALEFEYMYRSKSDVTADVYPESGPTKATWGAKSDTFMLNIGVDIIKHNLLRPYVKVGLGYSRNYAQDYVTQSYNNAGSITRTERYTGKTNNEFSWQVGTGLNMTLNKHFDVNIEYMYVDRGKIETENAYSFDAPNSNGFQTSESLNGKLVDNVFTVGLKLKF